MKKFISIRENIRALEKQALEHSFIAPVHDQNESASKNSENLEAISFIEVENKDLLSIREILNMDPLRRIERLSKKNVRLKNKSKDLIKHGAGLRSITLYESIVDALNNNSLNSTTLLNHIKSIKFKKTLWVSTKEKKKRIDEKLVRLDELWNKEIQESDERNIITLYSIANKVDGSTNNQEEVSKLKRRIAEEPNRNPKTLLII